MGRTMPMTVAFTVYERPWRLGSFTRSSMMETEGALTFESVADSTRMSWSWDVRPRGPLRLMTPIVGAIGRRQELSIWATSSACWSWTRRTNRQRPRSPRSPWRM
jgi:hypothetical protein